MNYVWGHNPGQKAVKNTLIKQDLGQRHDAPVFDAVIAPKDVMDDLGMTRTQVLEATVNGRKYIGGHHAARSRLAQRQQAEGRLAPESPMYRALVQMSAQALHFEPTDRVTIATALPVGWKNEANVRLMEHHIRDGLDGIVGIDNVYVQSEAAAVIYAELLTSSGTLRTDQRELASSLVAIGDLGGSTVNLSMVERMETIPGSAASPYLGSRILIEKVADHFGVQEPDAEAKIREEVLQPGADPTVGRLLDQYRESVIAELQSRWAGYKPSVYLFAGGTTNWFWIETRLGDRENMLVRTFGSAARVVTAPQQAIAGGLAHYAAMKQAKQQSGQDERMTG